MTALARHGREGGRRPLNDQTIREFLETSYPRLVAAVALVAGSRDAAEDAVQEALARAWERSDRTRPIESLPAWVTRVALNLSRSRLRRVRAERRAIGRLPRIETTVADDGSRPDVERALAALPRRQREVTVLHYYLGMDVREIAATLGVSDGTVKTQLFRARRALATSLGEGEAQEVDDGAELR
jgi:RNA polymerase sigma factor (sigma-70 family)